MIQREFHTQQLTPLAKAAICFRRHVSVRRRRFLGVTATALLLLAALGSALVFLRDAAAGATPAVAHPRPAAPQRASFPARPATAFVSAGTAVSQTPEAGPGSEEAAKMREAAKAAMVHSWDGYRQYAWGSDELAPPYRRGKHGAAPGATIVDAMSTLKIMGLDARFEDAVGWVKAFDFRNSSSGGGAGGKVSFFETTIRDLGGLLSAYDLTGDAELLAKARQVGDGLMGAFKPSLPAAAAAATTGVGVPSESTDSSRPAGSSEEVEIPFAQVNLLTGEAEAGWLGSNALLAEMGTIQLEMRQLSHYTGSKQYAQAADRISHLLEKKQREDPRGLWNTYINRESAEDGSPTLFTFGAMSDSAYEYLLKQWVQTGKREDWLWEMYSSAMDGMHEHLLQTDCPDLWWVADLREDGRMDQKMDHLACFLPGLLALGVAHRPDAPNAARDLHTAEKLLDTCVKMYTDQVTGLAPEFVRFKADTCRMEPGELLNLQRPETAESLMYMWRVTKQQKWRDAGRDIVLAFDACCKTETGGYTGLKDVQTGVQDHTQQSWWLAETLKYLYLLFSPDDVVPLDKYVFNTEAHPLLTWAGAD